LNKELEERQKKIEEEKAV
jgi:hypothetical protein